MHQQLRQCQDSLKSDKSPRETFDTVCMASYTDKSDNINHGVDPFVLISSNVQNCEEEERRKPRMKRNNQLYNE